MAWSYYKGYRQGISKYRSEKTEIDGIVFDSKKEAGRYQELSLLERAGEISDLQMQVKFVLIPQQREHDKVGKRGGKIKGKLLERECSYIADFVYTDNETGRKVIEDTKGVRTKEYLIKRKLMLYVHGIRISEV